MRSSYISSIATLVCLLFFSALSIGQTTFVKTGGTGTGNSWANAAGDLHQVLAQAQAGDEIWVAAGVYTPTSCSSCSVSQRDMAFDIPSGVDLYGGFSGSETSLTQRDFSTNVSILSGDIDADGQRDGNSYHVVTFDQADAQTRIDGFTISDGYANGSGGRQHGAAIFNDGSGTGNSSTPVIANCMLLNNRATSNGGAIYNDGFYGNSSPTVENCTFRLNNSREGGAMHNQGFQGESSPTVRNCLFENNASAAGGAVYNSGNDGISNPRYESCHFVGNDCTGYGGAVYNFAKNAGAQCFAVFANCIFDDNDGDGAAGAIYTLGSSNGDAQPRVVGCVFYDNYSRVGGAVYVNASDNGITHLRISNSIFSSSRANFDPILHFSGNSGPIITLEHVQLDALDCNTITGSSGGTLNCGAGLIFNANAEFANAASGDFHLLSTAPGVDAGDGSFFTALNVTQDIEGNARIQGGAADLGAFEFATGDSDGDGILDINDNCPFVANPAQVDGDSDGFGASCDCDDTDPLVNPDATEICDGIDNDCNLQIDEAGGTITYYADSDGDSYGDPMVTTTACSLPTGYVLDNTDCDDTDSATYPGAPELCDGKDNNCNNTIDEGAIDITPPVITCTSLSITAAAGSTTTITPADVFGSGSDNCSSVTLVSVSPSSFLLAGTYNVTLTAEDDAGNQATCMTTVTITIQTSNGSYCGLSASQPWTEWVANVTFADLDNTSSKCGTTCGYSNFTSEVASVLTGSDYDLVLTPGLSYNGYEPDLYWRTWIDWNQDGDFLDAGEMVASSDATFATTTQTITIPSNATAGTTRMRVAMRRDEAPLVCTDYLYGEVEDYTIAIAIGGPQVTIAGCPSNQSLTALPGQLETAASWTTPTVMSTCTSGGESVTQIAGPVSGSLFPIGDTEIVYAAEDACGSTDTCRFTITVAGQALNLSISCPMSQSLSVLPGNVTAIASWTTPVVSTNCPTGGETINRISGPASGSAFPLGATEVVYAAEDACGSVDTCRFTITVSAQPAVLSISCPANQSIQLAAGETDAVATWSDATATTTCPGGATVSQTAGALSGASFVVGTSTISYEATDVCGNIETCSFSVTVLPAQTNPGTYCVLAATQPWTEWVSNVAFADLDNASTKCGTTCGYSDFTSEVASVLTGSDFDLTLTPGLSYNGYEPDLYWRTWIDWNQDGDFLDAGELVASADATFAVVTQTITIPPTATPGTTRMRVAMRRDEAPTACTSYLNGEVEDYTVAVAIGGPQVTISGCPSSQSLSVLPGSTSAIASWVTPTVSSTCTTGGEVINRIAGPASGSSFPLGLTEVVYAASDACGNVDTCRFNITVSADPAVLSISCPANQSIQLAAGETDAIAMWSAATATTTCPGGSTVSQTAGALSGASFGIGTSTITYEATDACGNTETCSFTITVIPAQTNPGTYCVLEASQPWTEWVTNVAMANLDNASMKCGTTCGYSDFTSEVASVVAGSDYDLTLTPGLSYVGYEPDLYWRTWIDWNQDGDFLDAGELVASADATFETYTQTVSVPATAASGVTRMRVAMRRDAAPTACTSYILGEVEDYSVLVSTAPAARQLRFGHTGTTSPLSLKLYPNPVRDLLTLSASEGMVQLDIYSVTGQLVLSQKLAEQELVQVDVSRLTSGLYMTQVLLVSGERVTERVIVE
ncbi:MAG: HYR domain-containing protein [Saprospiraceae bacterium]